MTLERERGRLGGAKTGSFGTSQLISKNVSSKNKGRCRDGTVCL